MLATIKKELMHRRSLPTRQELPSEVLEYIEGRDHTTFADAPAGSRAMVLRYTGLVSGARKSIMSTLFSRDPPMDVWLERVDMLRPSGGKLKTIVRVLRSAGQYRVLVLDGSARRDQVAAALLPLRSQRPAIVIADSTWKSGPNRLDVLTNRLGIRAIDNSCAIFCVPSSFELESFPRTWGH